MTPRRARSKSTERICGISSETRFSIRWPSWPRSPSSSTSPSARTIRYGRAEATDEEVARAARAAQAEEFILQLPEGFDTPVGEFGLRLSGGQRQRITIARAILRDAPLLVFDEATSSLDSKTERAIQDMIDTLRGDPTIFIVSHRLSTIRHADLIVVLGDGKIIESGNHETLMAKGGAYRELATLQGAADPEARPA